MNIRDRKMMLWTAVCLVAAIAIAVNAQAAQLTVPNTFISGNPISSSQMNANFDTVENVVNGNRVFYSYNTGCGLNCNTTTQGSSAIVNINSIAVTATGPGVIVVDFNAIAECSLTLGSHIYLSGQILTSPSATPAGYLDGGNSVRFNSTYNGTYFHAFPMSAHRVFTVGAAATYTYYYNAYNFDTGAVGCKYYGANMSAIFIPTP